MTEEEDLLRREALEKAIHSFGKAYIFTKRTEFYKKWIRFVTILGIAVPVTIGATATGYGIDSEVLKQTIAISIPLTGFQLLVSIFSVVNNWSDNLSYSLEATNDYGSLSENFKKLGRNHLSKIDDFKHKLEILEIKYNSRSDQDTKYGLKERELRKGMNFSLREFQIACLGCGKTPLSSKSTNCEVCGNYKRNLIQKTLFNG